MKVFGKTIDRTLIASLLLHFLFLGGVMISFSSRAVTPPPEDVIPVDITTVGDLSKVMQGEKTAPKSETPKPRVEKIAEAKPNDDVGKVSEKPPIQTQTTQQQPPPTPPEKPVEKKPDPPKPVVEQKEPPKPAEKKPPPPKDDTAKKDDPIKDVLKDDAKQPPKPQQAKVTPPPPKPVQPPKPKERTFDLDKMAELIDNRDPTRKAQTGAELNNQASLGSAKGADASHAATWGAMFQRQVSRCWNKPFAGVDQNKFQPVFDIRLKQDGTLEGAPVPVSTGQSSPAFQTYQESARRAIIDCQPYNLPAAYFNEWKYFEPVFTGDAN